MTLIFPPAWIFGFFHLQVVLITLAVIPKWSSEGLQGPPKQLPPSKGVHLEWAQNEGVASSSSWSK